MIKNYEGYQEIFTQELKDAVNDSASASESKDYENCNIDDSDSSLDGEQVAKKIIL